MAAPFIWAAARQALAQSAQLLLAYSLPILILSACLTIPLLLWLFSRDVRRRPLAPAPAKGLGVTLFWTAVFGLGLCLSINILLALSPLAQYAADYQEVSTVLYGAALWQQLIGPALIIPLCEELIFRALMFRGLRDELPFWLLLSFPASPSPSTTATSTKALTPSASVYAWPGSTNAPTSSSPPSSSI